MQGHSCEEVVKIPTGNYKQLQTAIQDLLAELRISEDDLSIMANGYSPDFPGARDVAVNGPFTAPPSFCKIQISRVVAKELKEALNLKGI